MIFILGRKIGNELKYNMYKNKGVTMNIAQKIVENITTLPESKQIEVLDFVYFLKQKTETEAEKEWSQFSISSAMKGMESEESLYSMSDLKEIF